MLSCFFIASVSFCAALRYVSHSELNIENNIEFTGFAVLLWLSTRSKPAANVFGNDTGKHTLITPELAILPDKLCFIWSSTRDRKLRKFTLLDKHCYGLEFQISRKCSHFVRLILLGAWRHRNQPRSYRWFRNNGQFNNSWVKRSVFKCQKSKSTCSDKSVKICKISLLQQLAYSGNYDVVCVCETWLNKS